MLRVCAVLSYNFASRLKVDLKAGGAEGDVRDREPRAST